MKAQIESLIINTTARSLNAFGLLLNTIVAAKNEKELKENMGNIKFLLNEYFEFGFGKNHMWVHEKDFDGTPRINRLIYVEF